MLQPYLPPRLVAFFESRVRVRPRRPQSFSRLPPVRATSVPAPPERVPRAALSSATLRGRLPWPGSPRAVEPWVCRASPISSIYNWLALPGPTPVLLARSARVSAGMTQQIIKKAKIEALARAGKTPREIANCSLPCIPDAVPPRVVASERSIWLIVQFDPGHPAQRPSTLKCMQVPRGSHAQDCGGACAIHVQLLPTRLFAAKSYSEVSIA
jgi:hypothetical protein